MQPQDKTDRERRIRELTENARVAREFIKEYENEDPAAVQDEAAYLEQIEDELTKLRKEDV